MNKKCLFQKTKRHQIDKEKAEKIFLFYEIFLIITDSKFVGVKQKN